jgi:hypothetical protein
MYELAPYRELALTWHRYGASYRTPAFDALNISGLSRYWVDFEKDERLMSEIEVENLPSVFVLSNDKLS